MEFKALPSRLLTIETHDVGNLDNIVAAGIINGRSPVVVQKMKVGGCGIKILASDLFIKSQTL
jgi:hypothetical protein